MAEPKRPRISIDVTPELRRRIRLAAAAADVSVTEFCRRVIEERAGGGAERHGSSLKDRRKAAVERLRRLQAEIFAGRSLNDDSADIIREMRQERSRRL